MLTTYGFIPREMDNAFRMHIKRALIKMTAKSSDQSRYIYIFVMSECPLPLTKVNIHIWSCQNVSQRAHDVIMTSYQRRCDVMTSHRRRSDVIMTSCACWDATPYSFSGIILILDLEPSYTYKFLEFRWVPTASPRS